MTSEKGNGAKTIQFSSKAKNEGCVAAELAAPTILFRGKQTLSMSSTIALPGRPPPATAFLRFAIS